MSKKDKLACIGTIGDHNETVIEIWDRAQRVTGGHTRQFPVKMGNVGGYVSLVIPLMRDEVPEVAPEEEIDEVTLDADIPEDDGEDLD